jgi:hypothetical protein
MSDFGSVRRARGEMSNIWTIIAISVLLFSAVGGVILLKAWNAHLSVDTAETNAWLVTGPPCPTISAAAWRALAIAAPQRASFRGVAAERAHGDVACEVQDIDAAGHAAAPYPVCSFSAPLAIHLTTPQGDLYFQPGVGQPATISMAGGHPRCMMVAAGG